MERAHLTIAGFVMAPYAAARAVLAEDEVTLGVTERAGGFAIEVADRGNGLTEEVLRDALLPFYSTKPKGTGLGLTLCRETVDAHGGRRAIANRDGGGLCVAISLPGSATPPGH